MKNIELEPIGQIHSEFKTPNGIPRQAAAARDHRARIEIFEKFRPGLKDIEGFSHIMVVFYMHLAERTELTAHPPWDGKTRGVFSTCSPYRPARLGVSVVELEKVEQGSLHIKGVDMADGSPVVDIKPYIPQLFPAQDVKTGWLKNAKGMLNSKSGER